MSSAKKWAICRACRVGWPHRITDLTPLDFLFWGYIKNIVYAQNIQSLQHLMEGINDEIATVTPDMILRTWTEMDCCLDVCCATEGDHIKTY